MLIFRRTNYIHAAYGTVTVYEISLWPVSKHFECALCTDRPPRTLVELDSTVCCMYTVCPEDEHLRLETRTGT